MDDWNVNTHTNSGLVARVKASQHDEAKAVAETLEFIRQWVPERTSPLCGNSIGQDRRFMVKHMSELEAFFHYRNVDVSTIKELVRRWQPALLDQFKRAVPIRRWTTSANPLPNCSFTAATSSRSESAAGLVLSGC